MTLQEIEGLEDSLLLAKRAFLRSRGWEVTNKGRHVAYVKVLDGRQIVGDTDFALQYERNFQ